MNRITRVTLALLFALCAGDQLEARKTANASREVYVPVYSSIHFGDRGRQINLSVTLTVRNTSRKGALIVEAVDYYSSTGKLLRSYLSAPQVLGPLEAAHYLVKETDVSGGIAPSFLIKMKASDQEAVTLVEAVMIGAGGQLGISFVTHGIPLAEK